MSNDPNNLFGAKAGSEDPEGNGATGSGAEVVTDTETGKQATKGRLQEIEGKEDAAASEAGVQPLIITSLISGETVRINGTMTALSDNWNSSFNEEVVYGRIDPIPTYSNTTRAISVSIDLVPITKGGNTIANSSQASQIKIGKIARMCYPGYQSMDLGSGVSFNAAVLKSSPLVEIQHANVICSPDGGPLKAYIKSFNTNIQYDGLYSLANATNATAESTAIYYNRISISLEFGILHDQPMGYSENGNAKPQFSTYPYFFPEGDG